MSSVGAGMTKYMTVPLAAAGAASVKLATDYNRSLTKIKALTGTSTAEVSRWSSELQRWAGVVGETPKSLAEGLYFIASSGLEGKTAMDALKKSSIGAAVGMGETKTIADYATSAIGAYGQANMDAGRAIDILVAAVRYGKGEPEDFAQHLGFVTGTAAALNISLQEVVGSITAMTMKGLGVEEATTALNNLMMVTIKGAREGSDALDKYGLTYAEVRDSFANKGVLETLDLLNRKFGGNVEEMGKVFGNIRSMRAVMQLLKGDMSKTAEVIDNVRNSQGMLNDAWEKTQGDPSLQFRKTLAELQTAGIAIGNELLPALVTAAQEIGGLARAFGDLDEGTRKWIVRLGLATAAIGPLLSVAGRLVGLATTLGTAMPLAGGAGVTSAGATTTAGGLAAGAAIPVTIVAVTAAAAGALIYGEGKRTAAVRSTTGMERAAPSVAAGGYATRVDVTRAEAFNRTGADAARAAAQRANQPILQKLELKLSTADYDGKWRRILSDYNTFKTLTAQGIDLTIDEKKPLSSLQSIQARIMATGKTSEQALRIMERTFGKDVVKPLRNHMNRLGPTMSAAAQKVEARNAVMRRKLLAKLTMPRADNSALLGSIDSVIARLRAMGYTAGQAAAAVQRALHPGSGAAKGASLDARIGAQGLDAMVNSPTLFLAGEAGRERVQVTTYGGGAAETTFAKSSGAGIVITGNTFIGSPPEDWADFVQANAAEVMDMGFASQSEDERARGRGMVA